MKKFLRLTYPVAYLSVALLMACSHPELKKIAPVILNLYQAESTKSFVLTDSVEIRDQRNETVANFPVSNKRHTVTIAKEGYYEILYFNKAPDFEHLFFTNTIYLTPGSDLSILIDTATNRFGEVILSANFSGDHADINKFFVEQSKLWTVAYSDTSRSSVHISKVRLEAEKLLDKLSDDRLTPSFKESESKNIAYHYYKLLYKARDKIYSDQDGYDLADKQVTEAHFPVTHEEYDINNEEGLGMPHFENLAIGIIYFRGKYKTRNGNSSERVEFFNQIGALKSDEVKDYLTPKFYRWYHLPSNGGIEEFELLYTLARANLSSQSTINKVTKIYDEAKKFAPGAASPSFTISDHHGKKVTTTDFKGSYTYIDIWATWCGPCKKEIPFLQKLEEDYKDENIQFVSISIDKPNRKNTWLQMIEDKSLGGIQLIADQDYIKNVHEGFYDFNSIPQFILLDPDGKFVSAKAPRPSDPKCRNLFNHLFDKVEI